MLIHLTKTSAHSLVAVLLLLALLSCRGSVEHEAAAKLDSGPRPAAVSVTPADGSGPSQAFTFVVSDPNGAQSLGVVLGLVNQTLQFTGGCQFMYEHASDSLRLYSDTTDWSAPVEVGRAGTLNNGLCSIDAEHATVTSTGDTLTLHLPLAFSAKFSGAKIIYLLAQRGPYGHPAAHSDWEAKAVWRVP